MALTAGVRLGPYEIVSPLGAGGMGEVYKAHDTRLGRTVAIKVLPDQLSGHPDLRRRFEREARVISSLNHPHICVLYDVGHETGTDYLVMEYLEGETVAERLLRGPLPLDQALRISVEVADALDKAHRQGIIHCDLKPGNVMLTRDGAKLLDFGIARLWRPPDPAAARTAEGRTTALHTRALLLGTLQYMAPEQFDGKEPDPRADIFAFGCLLYEMVTGRPAFAGANSMEVVAAIARAGPAPVATIDGKAPAALDRVLQQCLAKDADERWQSARDLRKELQWIQQFPAAAVPTGSASRRSSVWILAILSAVLAVGLVISVWRRGMPSAGVPQSLVRFSIVLPGDQSLDESIGYSVALSPDGTRLAYVASRGSEQSIYIRSLDSLESVRLPGTARASSPFFSPDGEWIGFEAAGKLVKVPVSGGSPQVLCDVLFPAGATWGRDDTIVFTPLFTAGLFAIPARGGKPRRLTTPDSAQGEAAHLWPDFLPDGKHVLFTIWNGSTNWDQSRIALLSLDTGKWQILLEGGSFARYDPGGRLLYLRGDTLFAAPFDLKNLRVTGRPVQVVQGVLKELGTGAAYFSVSQAGTLAYTPGTPRTPARSLVTVDRTGKSRPIASARRAYNSPRVSPNGRRVAVWLEDATPNIWIHDSALGTLTRASFGADDHTPVWSPDGQRLAFESSRTGPHQVFEQPADGTGDATQLTTGQYDHYLCDWSSDGQHLIYVEWHPQTGADLWTLQLGGNTPPRPFLKSPFNEKQAAFSPNGRWLAYVSDESGQNEVYVQPFPGPGAKQQVSAGGGEEPAWSHSGRELFYRIGGRMMAVNTREGGDFSLDRPRRLFEGLFYYTAAPSRTYDVSPDGQFVMVGEPELEYATRQINVVLNWPANLTQPPH